MNSAEKNKKIFAFAQKYLEENLPVGLTKADLEKYYEPRQFKNLGDVYEQFIMSAQNRQAMPNIIKFNNEHPSEKARIKAILDRLCDGKSYDLARIRNLQPASLYETFSSELGVSGKSWEGWCKSVVDAAAWLCQFPDANAFKTFIQNNDSDCRKRSSLPDEIARHIHGMGFALVCDALKEMGFVSFSKPDVHIKRIFTSLGLSDDDDNRVFNALDELARDNGVSPYKADKIFWLICSGYFYKDRFVKGKHPKADDFIAKARNVLK